MGGMMCALSLLCFVVSRNVFNIMLAERTGCLEKFVCGVAFILAINWQFVATSEGFSAISIRNVTTHEAILHGCCHYRVTMTWQVVPLNQSHALSFKIWLTSDEKPIGNASIVEYQTANEISFQYTFVSLKPDMTYTAHVQGSTSMQNVTSYGSVNFYVRRTIFHKGVLTTNTSVENGYLIIRWSVEEKYRRSSTPISYNISLCYNYETPLLCDKEVWTMCSATYNPSNSSGHIKVCKQNWRKYIDRSRVHGDIKKPPLKSWSSRAYLFSCKIASDLCSDFSSRFQALLYHVDYGNGTHGRSFDKVFFGKGFLYTPDYINVTFPESNETNVITAQVEWRLGVTCEARPALNVRIILKKDGKAYSERNFNRYDMLIPYGSNKTRVVKQTQFTRLTPYSHYTIEFVTTGRSTKDKRTSSKSFRTPDKAPLSSPTIQPVVSGVYHCIKNKRNVTVSWKHPPPESRNGVIRNFTLKYYPTRNRSDARLVDLANVSSSKIFGLYCDIEYQVQVRACIHPVERSCGPYSKPQVIVLQVAPTEARLKTNESNVPLWSSVGVGLLLVCVCFGLCQHVYRRKRRTPLEALTENDGHIYEDGDKTELAQVGEYHGCYNDGEM